MTHSLDIIQDFFSTFPNKPHNIWTLWTDLLVMKPKWMETLRLEISFFKMTKVKSVKQILLPPVH